MKIPMDWRRFFLNIANNTLYINYCNNRNNFQSYCHEWYLYNLMKKNTKDFEN